MRPLRPRGPRPEQHVQDALRRALALAGWTVVVKMHGNAFQSGVPDLYAFHPVRQLHRWIEVKAPRGRLTPAQRARFQEWGDAGLGVYVMTNCDLAVLYREPNWKEWL